jgi:hypothetical protein
MAHSQTLLQSLSDILLTLTRMSFILQKWRQFSTWRGVGGGQPMRVRRRMMRGAVGGEGSALRMKESAKTHTDGHLAASLGAEGGEADLSVGLKALNEGGKVLGLRESACRVVSDMKAKKRQRATHRG